MVPWQARQSNVITHKHHAPVSPRQAGSPRQNRRFYRSQEAEEGQEEKEVIAAAAIFFPLCLLFLLVWSTPKDRAALWIVTLSNFVGWLLVLTVTRQIHAPWKLVIPGAGETLTILALITLGRNRSSYIQAVLLLIAWCAHLLCYLDCQTGSNLVYDHYEQILALVAVGQLLGFHDTYFNLARRVQRWGHIWASGGRFVSSATVGSDLVRNQAESSK